MKKKILVIAAHSDDEILGCGGTIAKHAKLYKDIITVVILGEGITSRDAKRNF
jgi:LmbE family N-acetylglucosaminyl deacetylase